MDSILISVKKMLGITEEYEHFDADIIMHINTTFMVLSQLGVGPETGFSITDKYQTWSEFIPENNILLESIKSYMYMKVKLMFDPPASSTIVEVMNRSITELEWRINSIVDYARKEE